jgi:hypothetical protein
MPILAKRDAIIFLPLATLLLGLPLVGLALAGIPVAEVLEFPPRTRHVAHAAFSWPVFIACAGLIGAAVFPLVRAGWRALRRYGLGPTPLRPLPWWGIAAMAAGALSWLLAWTRFEWFARLQPHTFLPLWLSYIVAVNALTCRRCGACLLTHRPGRMAGLFAASALFWWFFEYLNRFVENWYYQGAEYGPAMYAVLATGSFSTVLPAVLSTRDWLLTYDLFCRGWASWPKMPVGRTRTPAALGLILAGVGLAAVGRWPDWFFPLVWVAPLIVVVALQALFGAAPLLGDLARGNWGPWVAAAAAALWCGFFWEMWNAGSLVGWAYSIPYVHGGQIFAMPVLGYAGYLPFGLECAVIGQALLGPTPPDARRSVQGPPR